MGVYIPLRVRLTPASIPQVVAYIQTYLRDNPIPSIDTFADLIASFLSDHPELVAVASVNGKTGAVILTGADIMLNGDSALTLETEITNLNSMIAELSRQVAEAVATVENAQEDIDDLGSQISELEQTLTTIENSITQINNTITSDENLISANTTKNAQQDTRLQALENSLDDVDEDIDNLQTLTSLHTEQIEALNETIGDASEVLERIGEVEQDLSNLESSVSAIQTSVGSLQTSVSSLNSSMQTAQNNITSLQNSTTIKSGDHLTMAANTSLVVQGLITTSAKMIVFSLFLGKKITATGINVLIFKAVLRGVLGYLEGSLQQTDFLDSGYTIAKKDIVDAEHGIITFNITKSTAFTNATNNTPVSVEIYGENLDIEFT